MSYNVVEAYNMLAVYFQCFENPVIASREYAARYPERKHFSRRVFIRLARRLRETGQVLPIQAQNRIRRTRVEDNIINVLAYIEAYPKRSIRDIERDLVISRSVVHRILLEHKFHAYHVELHQALTPLDFDRRLDFCHWLLEMTRENQNFLNQILWTDEANFNSRGKVNLHNSHYWSKNNPYWMIEIDHQNQFSVNVWCGIIDGKIITFIFEETLNGARYLEFLINHLPNLLEEVPLETRVNMWLQHDGCSAHYALNVREYLNTQFPNRWIERGSLFPWPPRSPDLTVLDFYLWGRLKDIVYQTRPTTREDMIHRIRNAIASISVAEIETSVGATRRRLQSCIDNNGGHFEHLLKKS